MKEKITACFLCGCNCGLVMTLDEDDRIVKIRGDKENPRTKGFVCIKGLNQGAHIDSPHRLTKPLKRRGDKFIEVSWDEALDGVAEGLLRVRKAYGPRSLALALGGSGHPTLQVMLAFSLLRSLGSRNLYSPVGLELTSKYLANQKLFGCSYMDGYPNLEESEYSILIGTNHVISWPLSGPILKEVSKDPKRKLVVVDPRLTETGRLADIYTPIRPSTDIYFLMAMLQVILSENLFDPEIAYKYTSGFDDLKKCAARFTPEVAEEITGVKKEIIYEAARGYAKADPGVLLYDMGVIANRHSTLVSYIAQILTLITGNMNKKRGSLLNPTLMNSNKTEKMAFGGDTYVSRVRGYPEITGFMPVTVLQDEILTPGPGQIRGMIVTGCNPLRAYTNSAKMERAFKELEFLVSIDPFMMEAGRMAHYVLPVCSFHEQDSVSFGFQALYPTRFVQLTKKVREPLGQSRPEWMIYRDLTKRLGVNFLDSRAFHYGFELADLIHKLSGKPGEINRQNALIRFFARMGRTSYAELEAKPHGFSLTKGKSPDAMKEIRTPDKKARLNAPEFLTAIDRLPLTRPPKDAEYPLLLSTTCRTMANVNTIYQNEKWIAKHMPENSLIMHPDDAESLGVTDKEKVRLTSRTGSGEVSVSLSPDVLCGTVYLSHGWGLYSRDPNDTSGRLRGTAAALFLPDDEGDAFTGMPFFSGISCRVEKISGD